ncbi:DUF5683 domain-containing protein [Hymenobacter perfusus]|uniref:DUF5683 domain-containing protein n=1 Tax=Hymenobacter perfusus TaxID=1236770 RepID=A0A3R9N156_9BACT|nr:DUF5683 domain-containing protein [Hymenobacter perfusus]RSK45621.1 hypothetical protein EI293_00145 [Hymenobacter perfusus]
MASLLLLPGFTSQAQTVTAGPDSVQVTTKAAPDTARMTERLFGMRMTRPKKATLLALMLPGAGQIYNRRWWKLPLVYGGLGGVGYGLFFYQTRYKEYVNGKDQYLNSNPRIAFGDLNGDNVSQETSIDNIQRGIVFYRRNRDTFIAYTALVYGITVLDALVDAHLRDFDISDDLSLQVQPTLLPTHSIAPGAGLALTLRLK